MSTLGRATTAARGVSRSMKESGDIAHAQERQREAEAELKEAQAELEREVQELQDGAPDATIETTEVKPKKTGVDVRLVALAWKPSE
jgi:cell division protein FtsB